MLDFLKIFGEGLLFFLGLPFILVGLVLYGIYLLFVFIFMSIKGIILFFKGKKYSLILEENTPLFKKVEEGLELPNEDLERKMYWAVKQTLEQNNYIHYEISNFAKKGYESKHNLDCWNQKEYIGFGIAAHSYTNGIRYSNIENIEQYIKNYDEDKTEENLVFHEKQDMEAMQKEYMLLGLRKIDGVSIQEFKIKFVANPVFLYHSELEKLVNEELLEIDGDQIKLTNKGLDLANIVWEEFI